MLSYLLNSCGYSCKRLGWVSVLWSQNNCLSNPQQQQYLQTTNPGDGLICYPHLRNPVTRKVIQTSVSWQLLELSKEVGFLQLNTIETGVYHREVQTALTTVSSGPLIPAHPWSPRTISKHSNIKLVPDSLTAQPHHSAKNPVLNLDTTSIGNVLGSLVV